MLFVLDDFFGRAKFRVKSYFLKLIYSILLRTFLRGAPMYDHVELPSQYRLNHEKIDAQHAQLFACLMHMNQLLKNEDKKNNKQIEEAMNDVLRFLRGYAQNHFHYEESIMKKTHDPNFEQHQKFHNEFLNDIIALQLKGAKNHKSKMAILGEIALFIKNWYLNHILHEDKKIVDFEKEWNLNKK